jgi:hypothetical protein
MIVLLFSQDSFAVRHFYRAEGAEGLSPGFQPWEPYLHCGEP